MGLDMYLSGKLHSSKYGNKELNDQLREALKPFTNGFDWQENLATIDITFEVGYWRKANHIHKWFVDNVQGGEDECNAFDVTREQLKKLRSLCEQVLADNNLAPRLLPTQSGFFFGGTEYDEWYFEDVKATIAVVDRALSLPETVYFEYQSSW